MANCPSKAFLALGLLFLAFSLRGQSNIKIHAHNDYAQPTPFWNALSAGCASIEVDLIYQNDSLFVAHEMASIQSHRTFESLYLRPIQKSLEQDLVKQPFALLIDLKTAAKHTLPEVIKSIKRFPGLVKANENGLLKFIISGNRPKTAAYHEFPSFIQFDYQSATRIEDQKVLEKVAMVSLSFRSISSWKGKDTLPFGDKKRLKKIIDAAHAMGKPMRFWATPDTELAWATLSKMGVDYINTDKVTECTAYFKYKIP